MIFEPYPPTPFRSADITFSIAREAWELDGYFRLRREVFCAEQGVFEGEDLDTIDARALPIVALSAVAGVPDRVVGTVRIYEDPRGTWYGGRLSVHPEYRSLGSVGAGLIRKAVTTACARGCERFLAYVQERNEPLFRRLRWRTIECVTLHGRPHVRMEASLDHYRALAAGARPPSKVAPLEERP